MSGSRDLPVTSLASSVSTTPEPETDVRAEAKEQALAEQVNQDYLKELSKPTVRTIFDGYKEIIQQLDDKIAKISEQNKLLNQWCKEGLYSPDILIKAVHYQNDHNEHKNILQAVQGQSVTWSAAQAAECEAELVKMKAGISAKSDALERHIKASMLLSLQKQGGVKKDDEITPEIVAQKISNAKELIFTTLQTVAEAYFATLPVATEFKNSKTHCVQSLYWENMLEQFGSVVGIDPVNGSLLKTVGYGKVIAKQERVSITSEAGKRELGLVEGYRIQLSNFKKTKNKLNDNKRNALSAIQTIEQIKAEKEVHTEYFAKMKQLDDSKKAAADTYLKSMAQLKSEWKDNGIQSYFSTIDSVKKHLMDNKDLLEMVTLYNQVMVACKASDPIVKADKREFFAMLKSIVTGSESYRLLQKASEGLRGELLEYKEDKLIAKQDVLSRLQQMAVASILDPAIIDNAKGDLVNIQSLIVRSDLLSRTDRHVKDISWVNQQAEKTSVVLTDQVKQVIKELRGGLTVLRKKFLVSDNILSAVVLKRAAINRSHAEIEEKIIPDIREGRFNQEILNGRVENLKVEGSKKEAEIPGDLQKLNSTLQANDAAEGLDRLSLDQLYAQAKEKFETVKQLSQGAVFINEVRVDDERKSGRLIYAYREIDQSYQRFRQTYETFTQEEEKCASIEKRTQVWVDFGSASIAYSDFYQQTKQLSEEYERINDRVGANQLADIKSLIDRGASVQTIIERVKKDRDAAESEFSGKDGSFMLVCGLMSKAKISLESARDNHPDQGELFQAMAKVANSTYDDFQKRRLEIAKSIEKTASDLAALHVYAAATSDCARLKTGMKTSYAKSKNACDLTALISTAQAQALDDIKGGLLGQVVQKAKQLEADLSAARTSVKKAAQLMDSAEKYKSSAEQQLDIAKQQFPDYYARCQSKYDLAMRFYKEALPIKQEADAGLANAESRLNELNVSIAIKSNCDESHHLAGDFREEYKENFLVSVNKVLECEKTIIEKINKRQLTEISDTLKSAEENFKKAQSSFSKAQKLLSEANEKKSLAEQHLKSLAETFPDIAFYKRIVQTANEEYLKLNIFANNALSSLQRAQQCLSDLNKAAEIATGCASLYDAYVAVEKECQAIDLQSDALDKTPVDVKLAEVQEAKEESESSVRINSVMSAHTRVLSRLLEARDQHRLANQAWLEAPKTFNLFAKEAKEVGFSGGLKSSLEELLTRVGGKAVFVGTKVIDSTVRLQSVREKDLPGQIKRNYAKAVEERKRKIEMARTLEDFLSDQKHLVIMNHDLKFGGGSVLKLKDGNDMKDIKVQAGVSDLVNILNDDKKDITLKLNEIKIKAITKRDEAMKSCFGYFKRKKDGLADSLYKALADFDWNTCGSKELQTILAGIVEALPSSAGKAKVPVSKKTEVEIRNK